MEIEKVNSQEVTNTMAWLLEFNDETKSKIEGFIDAVGLRTFFLNIESLDLDQNAKNKLVTLRNVIEVIDGDVPSDHESEN